MRIISVLDGESSHVTRGIPLTSNAEVSSFRSADLLQPPVAIAILCSLELRSPFNTSSSTVNFRERADSLEMLKQACDKLSSYRVNRSRLTWKVVVIHKLRNNSGVRNVFIIAKIWSELDRTEDSRYRRKVKIGVDGH